jgi:predicted dehydrogenase
MNGKKISRRKFVQQAGLLSAGLLVGGYALNAKSYRNIVGANEKLRLAFVGLNSRGSSLIGTFGDVSGVDIPYVCDVEQKALANGMKAAADRGFSPKGVVDFRTILDDKNLDAVVHATPDHWHTPGAILCCQAGKNVYVEKPLSHNPAEGEMLVAAMKKYGVLVQMGSQRRSYPILQEAMRLLHEGEIGSIYMGKGWYVNNRPALKLTPAAVPSNLNYDLWQGPAPRQPYMDGLIHYNWHWLWIWGTGEALNNGTHELDMLLWGTKAGFPEKVTSTGGRYQYQDDWETPDTQLITWEMPGLTLTWEGRSRNGGKIEDSGRGVIFYGTKGSMKTGENDYIIYDMNGREVRKNSAKNIVAGDSRNTVSPSLQMDICHAINFVDAIRGKTAQTCTAEVGHKSTTYVQLGNIAHRAGGLILTDPANGHILKNRKAQGLWSRSYEKGWEPKV